MSSNVRSIIGRSVIGRAVHVKVYPRLKNLSESREILHVLQRYGEVVTYKNLKAWLLYWPFFYHTDTLADTVSPCT